jgi:3-hydroxybutyryl-CoA dehydrogenase
MTVSIERLGVVGAGTMGSGIAQLGCVAGLETHLFDPIPEALSKGEERLRAGIAKGAERGRWDAGADEHLRIAGGLEDLAACELVIEAVPERPDLKRELFGQLSDIAPDAVLATNTSSILVTGLATAAARPENVVGMHFFNPPPLMKLVEVIAAEQSGERAVAVACEVADRMQRTVIRATDGPGFLVNRCNRPFGAESLRLLQEGIATHEQIDRIVRLAGGFRMGPFELMDLVGIDVGFEVARSFMDQSFGEPRWKPSPLQARMVAAGRLGRKTGRGWYEYPPGRADDPEPLEPGGGDGRVVAIEGAGPLARELRARAERAGFDARQLVAVGGSEEPTLIVDASVPAPVSDLGELPQGPPLVAICGDRSLRARGNTEACGFHLIPPLGALVELTRLPSTPEPTIQAADEFFRALGFHREWVGDAPGLVLGRIVAQLVNEARFAVAEGVGSEEDVDMGLKLGMNHPRGPFEWDQEQAEAVLEGLWQERREERYRPAPR